MSGDESSSLAAAGVEAYTSLINGYSAVKDAVSAKRVYEQMMKRGVQPNTLTYVALVAALVLGKQRLCDCLVHSFTHAFTHTSHHSFMLPTYTMLYTTTTRRRPTCCRAVTGTRHHRALVQRRNRATPEQALQFMECLCDQYM